MYKHASRFQQQLREAEARREERLFTPTSKRKPKRKGKKLRSRNAVSPPRVHKAPEVGRVPLAKLAYAIRRGIVKI